MLHRFEVPFGGLSVLNRCNAGESAELAATMLNLGIHGFRLNPVIYLGVFNPGLHQASSAIAAFALLPDMGQIKCLPHFFT